MGDYESGYDPKYGYNRNAFAHPTLVTGLLGRTVRLIAAPIGLVSEAVHNRKDKKRGDSQSEGSSDESSSQMADPADDSAPVFVDVSPEQAEELIANKQAVPVDGEKPTHELVPTRDDQELGAGADDDDDEADWALDDAATAVEDDEPDGEIVSAKQSLSLTGLILSEKKPTSKSPSKPLPSPVVTPQRRPGTKARGFVRAYAPVLQDSGIDHETFLGFLKEFHKAAQAHPIFDVLMVATAIAGFYPDPIIDLGIQAAQIAVAVGQEIQERWYLNKFLEQANKDLFVPNGLVALVVTYTPANNVELEIGTQTVDIGASAVAKYGDSVVKSDDTSNADAETKKPTRLEDLREKSKRMRIASGKTRGEVELPAVCAPLIFPTPDTMEDKIASKNRNNPARFADDIRAKTKSSSKYVQDYFDRRAQTTYVRLPCFPAVENVLFENPERGMLIEYIGGRKP